jgi:hypothetical protein
MLKPMMNQRALERNKKLLRLLPDLLVPGLLLPQLLLLPLLLL